MKSLDEVREYFQNDIFAAKQGMQIDSIENGATCSVKINDTHLNAMGNVQGGLIYTLADFAFAVATNKGGTPTVTLNSTINYYGTPKDERLVAKATCTHNTARTCVYDIEVKDGLGNAVAGCRTTGYRIAAPVKP